MDTFRMEPIQGVPGLCIAYNAISEDTERRLFLSEPPGAESISTEAWKVYNLAKDCGLAKYMMPPDISRYICENFPKSQEESSHSGGIFQDFDGLKYGEYIVGLNLGADAQLSLPQEAQSLAQPGAEAISVILPRRAMYILVGKARKLVKQLVNTDSKVAQHVDWNRTGKRLTITLLSTKAFHIACLQRALADCLAADEVDAAKCKLLELRLKVQQEEQERSFLRDSLAQPRSYFKINRQKAENEFTTKLEASFWAWKLEQLLASSICETRFSEKELDPSVFKAMGPQTRKLYTHKFKSIEAKAAYVDRHGTVARLFSGVKDENGPELKLSTPVKREHGTAAAAARAAGPSGSGAASSQTLSEEESMLKSCEIAAEAAAAREAARLAEEEEELEQALEALVDSVRKRQLSEMMEERPEEEEEEYDEEEEEYEEEPLVYF